VLALWVIAALWYVAFLFRNAVFVAGGSDSSGYANAARMIRSGELISEVPILRELNLPPEWAVAFAPLGFWKAPEEGLIVPTYPLGYPAHMVALSLLLGERLGFFLITPLMAIAALFAMFFLLRELGASRQWSLAGTAVLAAFPTFTYFAVQPMSDVPALLWCTLAILCALKSERTPWLAVLAGVCFGIAVAVRPNNILVGLAVAMAVRWQPKQLALMASGAAPFGALLLWLNASLFGSPLVTGYGPLDDLMAWKYFEDRFLHYSKWLLFLGTPVLFPLGLLSRRRFLAAWFLAFFLFYCFYEHYDAWWYTRFLLPAIPALIAGSLLITRGIQPEVRAVLLAGVVLTGAFWSDQQGAPIVDRMEQIYPDAVSALEPRVPEHAVIVSMQMSGALKFYSGRNALRYDFVNPDRFELLRGHASIARQPVYALLFDDELQEAQKKTGATWTPVALHKGVGLYEIAH
jgi:hypothetical protein